MTIMKSVMLSRVCGFLSKFFKAAEHWFGKPKVEYLCFDLEKHDREKKEVEKKLRELYI